MRILFVSRKHPPQIGGMEQLSYQLIRGMRAQPDTTISAIVWTHGQRYLPWFFCLALVRSLGVCRSGIDIVHIGDPVLSWLGVILRSLFHVPIAITVHGLDLTFPFPLYQAFIPRWVARYDRVICISRAARDVALAHGVDENRCVIVQPAVTIPSFESSKMQSRQQLSAFLGRDLSHSRLLLTVGRLVPRKGVHFFVDRVVPALVARSSAYIYLVVGSGPDREHIIDAVQRHNLQEHVFLTGRLEQGRLEQAHRACDLFVAPNVPYAGDMEGFGLVVLEAAAAGCALLVADLEGLRDTLPPNEGNWYVCAGDAEAWQARIEALFASPDLLQASAETARTAAARHATWDEMARQYRIQFERAVRNG